MQWAVRCIQHAVLTPKLMPVQDLMLRNNTPPPGVVLLELQPQAVRQNGYEGGALALLRKMHSWGYTDVSHSGYAPPPSPVCPPAERPVSVRQVEPMLCGRHGTINLQRPSAGCNSDLGHNGLAYALMHAERDLHENDVQVIMCGKATSAACFLSWPPCNAKHSALVRAPQLKSQPCAQACVRRALAQHHALHPAAGRHPHGHAGGAQATHLVHAAPGQVRSHGGARPAQAAREHPLHLQGIAQAAREHPLHLQGGARPSFCHTHYRRKDCM